MVKYFGSKVGLASILTVAIIYCVVAWLGFTEESRRSLSVSKASATTGDYVVINLKVTGVDITQRMLHERLRLIPMGRFAVDKVTPAVDLKLLINSESGKQTVLYPKGERITTVDLTSALSGNQNRYPFDRYTSGIDLLVTAPVRAQGKAVKTIPEVSTDLEIDPLGTTLVVSPSDLNKNELVPINESFTASITSLKFDGQIRQDDGYKLMRTSVAMRRANSVISVSLLVMSAAVVLAISIMAMALQVIRSQDTMNLLPLSLCVTLIFGLPALRNIQPGVPAMGAVCDFLSFIWAELIVTTSAIGLAWTWIARSVKSQMT